MYSLRNLFRLCTQMLRNNQRMLTSQPSINTNANKEKTIVVDRIEAVTTIGINRPEKKNCLDITTARLLSEVLEEFDNDTETRVGLLYGMGGNFCAGYDLTEIAAYDGENEESLPHFGPLANQIQLSKKPLIASLSGYAVGVGFELALMCDLRVIEQTTMMGFLNRRFGIPILCGGTVHLPAMIGYSRAMDLILTGRLINAEEAFSWGIANRFTSCGAAFGTAINLAKSLVKFPQKSMLADRMSMHFGTFSSKQIDEALQFEKDNSSHLIFEEGVAGAKKFIEQGVGRHGKFQNIMTTPVINIKELDKTLL